MTAALASMSDVLDLSACRMGLQRRDELSGAGDGRVWAAELAPPIWTATVTLAARYIEQARDIDAAVRALGANGAMQFADPSYRGPRNDPGGVTLGASSVTVHTISADRTQVRLTGLPAVYPLKRGDRLSVAWGADRWWLAELGADVTASGGGLTALVAVYPYVPLGISAGAAVALAKPVCKMIVPPGGYTAFEAQPGWIATSASLTLMQRV